MDTGKLKKFAQLARRSLLEQVTAKLDLVLAPSSAARRENPSAVSELEKQIQQTSREQVIEKVAYTWFNRFCAIRFMDANGYTRIRVVSPADDAQVQPEILAEAKMGHIDEERCPAKTRDKINALLNGTLPSRDPQQEAYRLLLVAECNSFSRAMPYLFEHITDYTELLIPNDLLSANSILAATREAMATEDCQDVEVIGWLYQFYISGKKEEVDKKVKAGGKVTPEEISPKTALFTPHWIVRYLVENSLGRLWMLNHPNSPLANQMAYYIKPEQLDTDFLKIQKPEDIKVCDPACGSGHMLTYAFDLLYTIYEEAGTDPSEIPEKILTHNLYGIELDERAGDLAAFALTMKARAKQRRFLNTGVEPNICVLEKIVFNNEELDEYMTAIGRDLFTVELRETLTQFDEADNFGSLITPKLSMIQEVLALLKEKTFFDNLFLQKTHEKVLKTLQQSYFLSARYQIIVANPPYLDLGDMNKSLKSFIEKNYADTKQGLDSTFIENCLRKTVPYGFFALITQRSWMFLSRLEKFRRKTISNSTLRSLCYLGTEVFPEINGEKVQNAAFVFEKRLPTGQPCLFSDLSNTPGESKQYHFLNKKVSYKIPAEECLILPGAPLAFWVTKGMVQAFENKESLAKYSDIRVGLDTGDNESFIRAWFEVSNHRIIYTATCHEDVVNAKARWVPHTKGGEYRKWFGNLTDVIAFDIDDYHTLSAQGNKLPSRSFYFKEGVFYTRVSTGTASFRFSPAGTIFNSASPTAFIHPNYFGTIFGLLNSRISEEMLKCLSPTLNFQAGEIKKLPIPSDSIENHCFPLIQRLIKNAETDWNAYETAFGFCTFPLISSVKQNKMLSETYERLRADWRELTQSTKNLEEENNRIFIEAYNLQDELTPDVPLKEITLTCNPHFRYRGDKTEEELEALLLADTMRELISYAVGCMFGRYSLDKPGLVLANQGETLADYLAQVPNPSFTPDKDNVIPMLDGDWFADDITERFRQFLRITFGDEHYDENLTFIEEAIGKDIRKFFLRDFYNDHVKRYKKRPIYWLFSSPKGTFNALIYLHRYRPDTVSVVLSYLRDFRNKLDAHLQHLEQVSISTTASQAEKSRALKEIANLKKQLLELDDYEHDTLYPLATQQIAIDLDDGVKVNYLKFGSALKKIAGLEAKGED